MASCLDEANLWKGRYQRKARRERRVRTHLVGNIQSVNLWRQADVCLFRSVGSAKRVSDSSASYFPSERALTG